MGGQKRKVPNYKKNYTKKSSELGMKWKKKAAKCEFKKRREA